MQQHRLVSLSLAGIMIALIGCGGTKTDNATACRQETPKDTLATFAVAMETDDFETIQALEEPSTTGPGKTINLALKASQAALRELIGVVEAKIGQADANVVREALRRQGGGDRIKKAPTSGRPKVLTDGRLDESKFAIQVDGNTATVTVKNDTDNPGLNPLTLVKVDGKWYVWKPNARDMKLEDIQKAADQMKTAIDAETRKIEALTRQVSDGKIGKDKFASEFAKIHVGF